MLLALRRPWFKGDSCVFLSPCPGVTLRQNWGPECSLPHRTPSAVGRQRPLGPQPTLPSVPSGEMDDVLDRLCLLHHG